MKQMIEVQVNNKKFSVEVGSTIEEILILAKIELNHDYQKNPVVAALVNYEAFPLTHHLIYEAKIHEVRLFSSLGKRVYRNSICYLLALASNQIFPKRRLMIGHSLGDGYYYHYDDDNKLLSKEDIEKVSDRMKEIVSSNILIEKTKLPYKKALDYFIERNDGNSQTAQLLKYNPTSLVQLYKSGDFFDESLMPLVYRTGILSLWQLRPYKKEGMLLRYARSEDFTKLQNFKDNPLLFSVFEEYRKWNSILEMESVGQLNTYCNQGKITSYIRLAETLQWKKISAIADDIKSRNNIKTVFIAGPSSSGKTTFTHKLAINLRVLGKKPILISMDNYYRKKEDIPLDENGKKDFECLEALDLKQFKKDLSDLYKGKEVELPFFNFKKNMREYKGNIAKLKENTILLIEGIHGLNPRIMTDIEKESTYKVYISALTQLNLDDHNRISTTDNRLLRRIARDSRSRGTSALTTLIMWDGVQIGENKHIFPFQNNADVMLNSALDYELGALKPYAEPLLKTIEPNESNTYATARRLLILLSKVHTIPSDLVPKDSLLREFIGGSEFNVT